MDQPASTPEAGAASGLGAYKVTKHAVISLSETLYHELAERGARVRVSVLRSLQSLESEGSPGFVA